MKIYQKRKEKKESISHSNDRANGIHPMTPTHIGKNVPELINLQTIQCY